MSETYRVEQPGGNPQYPVIFEIEVFEEGLSPILYMTQPGTFPDYSNEMFIELETLVKLGELAAEAIKNRPTP